MNYMQKLLKMAQQVEPGNVYTSEIQHDDWCPLLRKTGPCTCDPTIVMHERDQHGNIVRTIEADDDNT